MEAFFEGMAGLLVIPIIVIVAGIALMRGLKGRFMDMIIILGIGIVGVIVLLNPSIIQNIAEAFGGDIESQVGGSSGP